MTENREQKIAKARELREQGWTFAAIGEHVGVHHGTVSRWLNPDLAQRNREENRVRNKARRANDPEYAERCATWYSRHFRTRCQMALRNSVVAAKKLGHVPCLATVDELMEAHTGFCECCGVPEHELKNRLGMGHDHETGEFRGWLCSNCNSGIGKLRENPFTMLNYLDPDRAKVLFGLFVSSYASDYGV